jgi:single-stranded DNA-binding protein
MTAALVTGTLFKAAEQRQSKTGRPFVVATIKVKDREDWQWWRLTAFSESAQSELLRLAEGDALSAQGHLTAGLFTKDSGETKITFSIVADHVLALRQPPKERKPKPEPARPEPPDPRSRQERCAGSWQRPADGPSDDLPF